MKETYRQAVENGQVMEKCVLCGRLIRIKRDSHISDRQYYVEGAGQLCDRCYHEVYQD